MLKKGIVLLSPFAAAAAIAVTPAMTTSASADCVYAPGTPQTPQYCIVVCHVPSVIGKRLAKAKSLILHHDCTVGKVKRVGKKHKKGFHHAGKKVVKQNPKAGGFYSQGTAVNLKWRWIFKKNH